MSFSSLDDMIAKLSGGQQWDAPYFKSHVASGSGTAGRAYDLFKATGIPAAGDYSGSAGVAAALSSATTGAIDIGANVSPSTRHLLASSMWTLSSTGIPSTLVLLDLLLYYPGLSANTPTSLDNTVTLPRYIDGVGVYAFLVVTTALGAATPSITLTYTNQDGTGSRTSAAVVAAANSLPTPTLIGAQPFVPLQAGDRGVRSVQSYAINSGGTGTGAFAMVLAREITRLPLSEQYEMIERDLISDLPSLPRIYDGACLSYLCLAGAALANGSQFQGFLNMGWG